MPTGLASFPLLWPDGWKRTPPQERRRARFTERRFVTTPQWADEVWDRLTFEGAFKRADAELDLMDNVRGARICTDVPLKQVREHEPGSGFYLYVPQLSPFAPEDPGAVIYWETCDREPRCIAIDLYDRVEDNVAAIVATLQAMRAVERHGGGEVLKRVFTGFTALDGPRSARQKTWFEVLDCKEADTTDRVIKRYKQRRGALHPDRGGDAAQFAELQAAWDTFRKMRGLAA
jgi:hypothetical protein